MYLKNGSIDQAQILQQFNLDKGLNCCEILSPIVQSVILSGQPRSSGLRSWAHRTSVETTASLTSHSLRPVRSQSLWFFRLKKRCRESSLSEEVANLTPFVRIRSLPISETSLTDCSFHILGWILKRKVQPKKWQTAIQEVLWCNPVIRNIIFITT